MKNTFNTPEEIRLYSDIANRAFVKYELWLDEYMKEKEEYYMEIIRKRT